MISSSFTQKSYKMGAKEDCRCKCEAKITDKYPILDWLIKLNIVPRCNDDALSFQKFRETL